MSLFAPAQEISDLLSAALVAIRIAGIWILLCPATVAIEGYADMSGSLGEVEIFDNPPLIEGIEQRLDSTTNTS